MIFFSLRLNNGHLFLSCGGWEFQGQGATDSGMGVGHLLPGSWKVRISSMIYLFIYLFIVVGFVIH